MLLNHVTHAFSQARDVCVLKQKHVVVPCFHSPPDSNPLHTYFMSGACIRWFAEAQNVLESCHTPHHTPRKTSDASFEFILQVFQSIDCFPFIPALAGGQWKYECQYYKEYSGATCTDKRSSSNAIEVFGNPWWNHLGHYARRYGSLLISFKFRIR